MRTRIHHAGINTADLARWSEGHPILISYADIVQRPGVWERELLPRLERKAWPSVILDSGAFTELGDPTFHVDIDAYADFALQFGHLFTFVVNLDDIRGNVDRSQRNLDHLRDRGVPAIPVFHQGEDWDVLEAMVQEGGMIGVGFQRPIRGAKAFLNEFFARVDGRVPVHGFGMNSWALQGYPFATTDSKTWICETCAILRDESPLARDVAALGKAVAARLTAESYRQAPPIQSADDAAWIENASHGQARSVFRRYGAKALTAELRRLTGVHLILERKVA